MPQGGSNRSAGRIQRSSRIGTIKPASGDDCAGHELLAKFSLVTEEPASYLVHKHRERMAGPGGHGQKAWKELHSKYMTAADETTRCKSAELVATTMKPRQDPDEYFLWASFLRDREENVGEFIKDRTFKDIIVRGMTEYYQDIKLVMYLDPSFGLEPPPVLVNASSIPKLR